MSVSHPSTQAWDDAVHAAIVATEEEMEARFGLDLPLRDNRPAFGQTANPQASGLFNIGLVFTTGAGSRFGMGYLLDVEVASREPPSQERYELYVDTCRGILEREIGLRLPGRNLRFERDSDGWKLRGDTSLGRA
jgi:hypothetical protein